MSVTKSLVVAPTNRRWTTMDLGLAAGVSLLAGLVYWRGAAPGLLFGDSGELQFAAWLAGLPHPTGYPLYILLGWAWTHLLAGLGLAEPARALNLLSAVFAALAVGLVYGTARLLAALGAPSSSPAAQRLAGLLAALTFAFTPTFWGQALVAEVYALHAALLALILGLALQWRSAPAASRGRWLAALGLALGLGLAHHRTTVLLLPVVAAFVWVDSGRGRRLRDLARLVAFAALPLLLYAFVPWAAARTPYLTVELAPGQAVELVDRSPAGLLSYVAGRTFAGELQGVGAAAQAVPDGLRRLRAELTWGGLFLAAVGLLHLARRGPRDVLGLTAGSFALLFGFNLFYTIGDIQVFYIGPALIACLWIGVAAAAAEGLAPALSKVLGRPLSPRTAALLGLPVAILPLVLIFSHADAVSRRNDHRAEQWWRQLLAADPPAGALLVTNDRDEMMPLWYLQQVEGARPDLTGIFPGLLPGDRWSDVGRVVEQALATGRPVARIKPMPGREVKAALGEPDPASGLTPVLGLHGDATPQRQQDTVLGNVVRLGGYNVSPLLAGPGSTLQVDLYWEPLQPLAVDLTSFVHLLLPDGTPIAQSDHRPGGVYYPTSLWRPGEVLRDRHWLSIPAEAEPGPYRLVAGLYELVDGQAQLLDQTPLGGSVGGERPPVVAGLVIKRTYANFADRIVLAGYEVGGPRLDVASLFGTAPEKGLPEDVLVLRLMWQPIRPSDRDYTLFVHLVDQSGTIVAQHDGPPMGGRYPTSVWQPGEALLDAVRMTLPADLPSGRYRLLVGLYDATDPNLPRLPARDAEGRRFPADQVPLLEVDVQ
ncbi:MAG: DUF2723 domain-containing protein [Caldilineales bacterium]|nr:DUF2723 domain-containing protein [Caldilineales bacterium]